MKKAAIIPIIDQATSCSHQVLQLKRLRPLLVIGKIYETKAIGDKITKIQSIIYLIMKRAEKRIKINPAKKLKTIITIICIAADIFVQRLKPAVTRRFQTL
jgi:hypothetical protein